MATKSKAKGNQKGCEAREDRACAAFLQLSFYHQEHAALRAKPYLMRRLPYCLRALTA
ncbi:hypothetical protein [Paenibacillus sp. BIHB 4019]|uniref:hypothetical protein n=1 Tax=Paenibacillus sp. BIHB 4019 TaxID=1870819 RepID=UPI0015586D35|nr:hypothetical protein [Paenibacillus sp. BIHB 4019]